MEVHSSYQAQLGLLPVDKAPTKVLPEYSDYADIFSFNLVIELPKNTSINKHAIKLAEGKQLLYRPIYSLKLIKLETLKTYIKTHLKTEFIWLFQSSIGTFIFFDQKPDKSFCLYANYQGLNNLTIKNWYLFPLISKALDRQGF